MERILACIDRGPATGTILRRASSLARGLGAELTVLHVAEGSPADTILEQARSKGAGLIVLGGRGSLPELSLGSVARSVMSRTTRPVVIVR